MRQPDPFLSEKISSKKKKSTVGDTAAIFQSMDGAGSRCAKIFSSPTIPPPKKTLLQGLVVLGLPLSIEIQYAHSLTHSPFPSFLLFFPFDPRSPRWDIICGGKYTLTRSSIPRVSYHLRSRCCFPPFFSSYGGFAIENKLFSSLLILSLLSLFSLCPRVFPVGERRLD